MLTCSPITIVGSWSYNIHVDTCTETQFKCLNLQIHLNLISEKMCLIIPYKNNIIKGAVVKAVGANTSAVLGYYSSLTQ